MGVRKVIMAMIHTNRLISMTIYMSMNAAQITYIITHDLHM